MKGKRVLALVYKECLQIKRDPSTLLIAFIFPLLLLFIYGYGISLDIKEMKLCCLMEDRSPPAMSFVQSLSQSPFFSVSFVDSMPQVEASVTQGKSLGGVVVPSYFSKFLYDPFEKAPIFVAADGSQPNSASFVQNYVASAFANWSVQRALEEDLSPSPTVELVPRIWYNEELNSHYFLIPGSIAIIMTLIGTILTALVIAREWERGTMEALMATPITIVEILLGKMIPYFFLGLLSMLICTGLGCFLFGVPLRGSLLALLGVSSVFLITALGLGLLISSLTKNQFNASQIAIVAAFLPAFMLSGFIFEISSMPFRIQLLTWLIPAKYMVSSLQTIFLVGDVWALLLHNCFALLLFGFIIFMIMVFMAKKRLD